MERTGCQISSFGKGTHRLSHLSCLHYDIYGSNEACVNCARMSIETYAVTATHISDRARLVYDLALQNGDGGREYEDSMYDWSTNPRNGLVVVAQSIGHDFGVISPPTSTSFMTAAEQYHMAVIDLSMGVAERPSFLLGGDSEDEIEEKFGCRIGLCGVGRHEIGITDPYVHIVSASKESVAACVRYFHRNLSRAMS